MGKWWIFTKDLWELKWEVEEVLWLIQDHEPEYDWLRFQRNSHANRDECKDPWTEKKKNKINEFESDYHKICHKRKTA